MSGSATDVCLEFLRATDAQDFDCYDDLMTEDVIAHFPGSVDMDREQVEQNERAFATSFPDIRRTVEDLIADGDRVVARITVRGTHEAEFQRNRGHRSVGEDDRDRHLPSSAWSDR